MRGWYGEYELPGVHSEAFPEQDEKSDGAGGAGERSGRDYHPDDLARTAAQAAKNQQFLWTQTGWRWSLGILVVPQKRFTVLAVAKRFGAASAARGETGTHIAVCKAVLKIGTTNELI
jgi:hypothetical protein